MKVWATHSERTLALRWRRRLVSAGKLHCMQHPLYLNNEMGRRSRGGVATIAQRERQNVHSCSNANEMKQCRRSLRVRCTRPQREIMLQKVGVKI